MVFLEIYEDAKVEVEYRVVELLSRVITQTDPELRTKIGKIAEKIIQNSQEELKERNGTLFAIYPTKGTIITVYDKDKKYLGRIIVDSWVIANDLDGRIYISDWKHPEIAVNGLINDPEIRKVVLEKTKEVIQKIEDEIYYDMAMESYPDPMEMDYF